VRQVETLAEQRRRAAGIAGIKHRVPQGVEPGGDQGRFTQLARQRQRFFNVNRGRRFELAGGALAAILFAAGAVPPRLVRSTPPSAAAGACRAKV
jgi:hypothetical protein